MLQRFGHFSEPKRKRPVHGEVCPRMKSDRIGGRKPERDMHDPTPLGSVHEEPSNKFVSLRAE